MVTLGEKVPAWGLSRWAGQGLRFLPPDDEGFIIRGNKQRLTYKGRRRSHRFTILGDTAFEYDCILEKEPESNVITLLMEEAEKGSPAESYDFLRQPDFVKDPFLKGSYAVYKKETLVGEGTGKLCHIHRPQIIDSRGRRCWGELSVVGNQLRIAIPETWLSEAKYPVIVDPTIGTTTVGSQYAWNNDGEIQELFCEFSLMVNKVMIPETMTGTAAAFVYVHNEDYEGTCQPVFYYDNNDTPKMRASTGEGFFDIAVGGGKNPEWRSAPVSCGDPVTAGSYLWFGFSGKWFNPRFDYGEKCYWDDYFTKYDSDTPIPPLYPLYRADQYFNFKLSMYFTYTSAQNYIRTLTQGVTLTDSRKQTAGYKRSMVISTNCLTLLGHSSDYYREHSGGITVTGALGRFRGFFRSIAEQVKTTEQLTRRGDFLRAVILLVRPETREQRTLSARRGVADRAGTGDSTARERGFIRTLVAAVAAADYTKKVSALLRGIREEVSTFGKSGHVGDYIRGLYTEAGSMAETKHRGEYYRAVEDTAGSTAFSPRHLFIFIRLVTLSLVRDYLLSRFLRSRDELVLKSAVARELELDSSIL
ncbi:MAG: hypothetical protein LBB83_05725 [Treponema sp.]|nr:hypothetical protein [Treponema sp.]